MRGEWCEEDFFFKVRHRVVDPNFFPTLTFHIISDPDLIIDPTTDQIHTLDTR